MQISAGRQLSVWHRISDLIFSARRWLGCLAGSLLQSCFISLLRIWNVWFSPSLLLCSLMLFSLCLYAWFINSCHSVAQILTYPGSRRTSEGFFIKPAQPSQNRTVHREPGVSLSLKKTLRRAKVSQKLEVCSNELVIRENNCIIFSPTVGKFMI